MTRPVTTLRRLWVHTLYYLRMAFVSLAYPGTKTMLSIPKIIDQQASEYEALRAWRDDALAELQTNSRRGTR